MNFTDYDRISDLLLYLSSNISLSFNVVLASKDKSGSRRFFEYETEYQSKYIGTDTGRAIKRNMRFYFTIDNKTSFGEGFVIKPSDVYFLTTTIEKHIFPWFFDEKKRIFKVIDNQLVIKGAYNPTTYLQNEYKYLRFTPIVYSFDSGTYKEGIRMEVNHDTEYADMEIDQFINFYHILKNTDMYSAACSMVNFVKMEPYGINVYSQRGLGGGSPLPDWQEESSSNTTGKGNNNFLDSVKEKGKEKK